MEENLIIRYPVKQILKYLYLRDTNSKWFHTFFYEYFEKHGLVHNKLLETYVPSSYLT